MVITTEVFSRVLSEISKGVKNSSADNTSSWSALLQWYPHPEDFKTARKCRLLLVALSFLGIDTSSKEAIYRTISIRSAHAEHEGEWKRVDEALKHNLIPRVQLELHCWDRSEDDFFGNDLPTMIKMLRRIKVRNPYLPRTQKVRTPKRKRGYDDKGHLRADSLPLSLRPTRPDYSPAVDYHKDSTYQIVPEEYRKDSDEQQRGIVERTSSLGRQEVILQQDRETQEALKAKKDKSSNQLDLSSLAQEGREFAKKFQK